MTGGEQLVRMRGGSRHRPAAAWRRVVGSLLLVALCVLVLGACAGPGAAQQNGTAAAADDTDNTTEVNDTTAPEWVNATKAWPTEIDLRFEDTSDIDRTSITPDDVSLSRGNVTNVSVESANGRNYSEVTATLILEERLNVDTVTVSIVGNVTDTAGNGLTNGTKTVTGMDTLVPTVEAFEVTRVNKSTVDIRLATNESLRGLELAVTGPEPDRLNRSDFTATDGTNTTFRTRYRVEEYGSYSFVWERAVDRYGNLRVLSRMRQFRYDDPAPDIVLEGPEQTAVGLEEEFDASGTTDEHDIESYRWQIDGGTVLSGPSIRVAFATAGTHDITLTVTDDRDNTAVETRRVFVRETASGPRLVSLTRTNASHANATVEGTGVVQQIRPENGPIVAGDNVTLDRLTAAFPASRTVSLDLRATDGRSQSIDGPQFGQFDIGHDGPANRVSLRVGVDRAALNRTALDAADISLYRDADGWTPLTTSIVNRTDRRVVYRATSPGLSTFAVGVGANDGSVTLVGQAESAGNDSGSAQSTVQQRDDSSSAAEGEGTPTGRPNITVTNVTVDATTPGVGETINITVTARNGGTAAGSYPFSVRLNGTSVATHELSVPAGETTSRRYEQRLTDEGSLVVAGESVATVGGEDRSLLGGVLAGLPNPLALWPGGLLGTVLGAFVGLVVVVYSILKALAIYLGY